MIIIKALFTLFIAYCWLWLGAVCLVLLMEVVRWVVRFHQTGRMPWEGAP